MRFSMLDIHLKVDRRFISEPFREYLILIDSTVKKFGIEAYTDFIAIRTMKEFEAYTLKMGLPKHSFDSERKEALHYTTVATLAWLNYSEDRSITNFINDMSLVEQNPAEEEGPRDDMGVYLRVHFPTSYKLIDRFFDEDVHSPLFLIAKSYNSWENTHGGNFYDYCMVQLFKEEYPLFEAVLRNVFKTAKARNAYEFYFLHEVLNHSRSYEAAAFVSYLYATETRKLLTQKEAENSFYLDSLMTFTSQLLDGDSLRLDSIYAKRIRYTITDTLFFKREPEAGIRITPQALEPVLEHISDSLGSLLTGKTLFNTISLEEYGTLNEFERELVRYCYLTSRFSTPWEAKYEGYIDTSDFIREENIKSLFPHLKKRVPVTSDSFDDYAEKVYKEGLNVILF